MENKKRKWQGWLIGAIAIVVVVAVIATIVSIRNKKLAKAENVLANALTEEALIKAINEYGNYEAADFARLKLARIYIDKKEFAKAAAEYKKVSSNTASQDLKERMQLDLAYLLEKEGKIADALVAFKSAGDAVNNSASVRAEAYYSAGRLALLEKDSTNAQIYLEQVKTLASSIEGGNLYGELATALLAEIK